MQSYPLVQGLYAEFSIDICTVSADPGVNNGFAAATKFAPN